MKTLRLLITTLTTLLLTVSSPAAVLYEGWNKITSGGQHVGFVVLRVEFDEKKKQFISTSYTQTSSLGGELKESLVAVSNDKIDPISYQYTSQVGTTLKTIDATFSKDMMTAKVTEGEKTETIKNTLPKGTFLSQFLPIVILQNPKGLKVGANYKYTAVAEEQAKHHSGEAYVSAMEKTKGMDAYKILNTYIGTRYISFLTPRGVPILTRSPTQSLEVEMTNNREEATKGFQVNQKTLSTLFTNVPDKLVGASFVSVATPAPAAPATPAPATPASAENTPADAAKAKAFEEPNSEKLPKGIAPPPGKGN